MMYSKNQYLILTLALFTFQASRSHRIYFVAADSRWNTTASSPAPSICGNLDSWINQDHISDQKAKSSMSLNPYPQLHLRLRIFLYQL